MDYYLLTDMTAQIGYELAAAGAETFRIEETMRRVLVVLRHRLRDLRHSQLRHGQP